MRKRWKRVAKAASHPIAEAQPKVERMAAFGIARRRAECPHLGRVADNEMMGMRAAGADPFVLLVQRQPKAGATCVKMLSIMCAL